MGAELRTSIIVDYQNVHLTGHGLFESTRDLGRHETLIDPLLFATRLLQVRNARKPAAMPQAVLRRVQVFRGHPSVDHDPDGYARNLAQQAHWERDRRVQVTLRPLKYEYERAADGKPATDHAGKRIVKGKPKEKGVDVMCALAAVRAAADPATDLVILATSDSDLIPVLDEVLDLKAARIETFNWYCELKRKGFQLWPTDRSIRIWNTRLNETAFRATWDPTQYD
ncbi:hypothetical protein [Kribbella sp. NPDC048928]|uniref:hypothetical protein n=1 Tax=Kribbella sp. NPDC048928 TaxID=3364111 RepID=UPI00371650C0